MLTSYIGPYFFFILPLPLNSSPISLFWLSAAIDSHPTTLHFCLFIMPTMLVLSLNPFGQNPTIGPLSKDYGEHTLAGLLQQTTCFPHYSLMFHQRWESDSRWARQSLAKNMKHFGGLIKLAKVVWINNGKTAQIPPLLSTDFHFELTKKAFRILHPQKLVLANSNLLSKFKFSGMLCELLHLFCGDSHSNAAFHVCPDG